jgi:hypothetical protein
MPESVERVGILRETFYSGKVNAVLPARNAALAPTIEIIGLTDQGWYIEIKDGFGSVIWERLLEGCTMEELRARTVMHHGLPDAGP